MTRGRWLLAAAAAVDVGLVLAAQAVVWRTLPIAGTQAVAAAAAAPAATFVACLLPAVPARWWRGTVGQRLAGVRLGPEGQGPVRLAGTVWLTVVAASAGVWAAGLVSPSPAAAAVGYVAGLVAASSLVPAVAGTDVAGTGRADGRALLRTVVAATATTALAVGLVVA